MEIYIIRHTPVDVEKGTCYGQSEVRLSNDFNKYVEYYKKELPQDFELIYTSPLDRCLTLTKALNFSDIEYIIDERLMEMHFGDWELKNWNTIPYDESKNWMENFDYISTPNGESMKDLLDRINSFYETLKTLPYQKVLIVTHSGPIRCFWSIILDIALKNSFKIPVGYGEILVINTSYDTIIRKI